MMLKKLTIAGCVVLSLGIAGVGGGALLVRPSRAQEPKPAPAATPVTTTRHELWPSLPIQPQHR